MNDILIASLFMIFSFAFCAWYMFHSNKLFDKHQKEWDFIKANIQGEDELFDEYIKYMDSLPLSIFGYCYPRM